MDDLNGEITVQRMAQQVKHYLITLIGKTANEATDDEFYRALNWVLREEIMINWTATVHTHMNKKARRVYYFSLEWLPGRLTLNNAVNISSLDLLQRVIKFMGRNPVQILCAEHEPGLGNGGLGRLAACFLDSLATGHYPAVGYGLRYQYGIFEQELWYGVQVERPDSWLLNEYPLEMRRDGLAVTARFGGRVVPMKNKQGEDVLHLVNSEDVRTIPYDIPIVGYGGKTDFSALTLRLWSTQDSPRNFQLARFNAGDLSDATKNTTVTAVLYPNDKNDLGRQMRIKQEYLLVTASLQDIFRQYFLMCPTLDEFADLIRIQINDTHPTLVISELMRILTRHHNVAWEKAWEMTRTVCSYTNHTVLKESLEEWEGELLKEVLPRQYAIIEKINYDFCNQVRVKYPGNEEKVRSMSIIENGRVRMAHLAIVGSHKVNGVAKLHSEILKKELFPDFDQMYPNLFTNVTNGVTQRRWLHLCNPSLSKFITSLIGPDWITDLNQLKNLAPYANEKEIQDQFYKIKLENKKKLLDFLGNVKKERYGDTVDLSKELFLEGDAIFDVQIKRIHEYKRQLMKALQIIMMYNRIRQNPNAQIVKRKVLMAGKAAPGYDMAKNIIRLFYMLGRKINTDPIVGSKLKVIYIENYNVSKAEIIIPATDLSNQISTAGQEASGTSNMKFAINGALTIGTEDGANVEMREAVTDSWWPFRFGRTVGELSRMRAEGSYNPRKVIERDIEISEAVESLINGTFADNEVEAAVLKEIYDSLLNQNNPDRYFVLEDLRSYDEAQKRVEDLYLKPQEWAKFCIHNISSMGSFSSDESIKNYAKNIWELQTCPIDKEELRRVRKEFLESDRCFIA